MINISSYPSVEAFHHEGVIDLLQGTVDVEEKIDGSQFSATIDKSGNAYFRSKGQAIGKDNGQFRSAIEAVLIRKHKMIPGCIYRFEFLSKPKHNILAYERVPKGNLILFDVESEEGEFASYELKVSHAERVGFEVVPLVARLENPTLDEIKALVDRESILGGKVEGVVVKNREVNPFGRPMVGKVVAERFKERMDSPKKPSAGLEGIVADFIAELKTEARWDKAVQHLRDEGMLSGEMKDIGPLMKELHADLLKEHEKEITDKVMGFVFNQITKGVAAGFPEWYRGKLEEKALGGS